LTFDVDGAKFKSHRFKHHTSNFKPEIPSKREFILAKLAVSRYNNVANLIKVLVRGNPPGLVQWEPMNLVRSERKQQ
jgi:hypothetical protein